MKTVADLKRRVIVGTRLVLVAVEGSHWANKNIGKVRTVVHVQGDSFVLAEDPTAPRGPNWYWAKWPKRDNLAWDADGDGFVISLPAANLAYRFAP